MLYNIQGILLNNKIEHFEQHRITYKSNSKCVSFCGVNGRYLCKLPYKHYHNDVINKKNVKIQYEPLCGHCINDIRPIIKI